MVAINIVISPEFCDVAAIIMAGGDGRYVEN